MVSRVGRIMSAGEPLPSAARTPTTEVGMSCMLVAFRAKNMQEAYSACGELFSSFAACIPYGVAAAPMPSRLAARFMLTAEIVCSSSVLKSFLARGFTSLDTPRVKPQSSHTCISPSHTAYEASRAIQRLAAEPAPSKTVVKNSSGSVKRTAVPQIKNRKRKIAFIL